MNMGQMMIDLRFLKKCCTLRNKWDEILHEHTWLNYVLSHLLAFPYFIKNPIKTFSA